MVRRYGPQSGRVGDPRSSSRPFWTTNGGGLVVVDLVPTSATERGDDPRTSVGCPGWWWGTGGVVGVVVNRGGGGRGAPFVLDCGLPWSVVGFKGDERSRRKVFRTSERPKFLRFRYRGSTKTGRWVNVGFSECDWCNVSPNTTTQRVSGTRSSW